MDFVQEVARSFRPADAFDIALVAIFVYTGLTWFKETTSRSVLVGVGLLTLVYFAARALDMFMTVFLFQAVFAVLLIALVVVFQEDLRRAFERLAALGTVTDRLRPATEFAEIDSLVEIASDLAAKKVGALIVLKGEEPLDRHVDGGIPMDGHISKPLLDSIFDPHSMGHDGAVIIEKERIRQFAAHLPLSKNKKQIGTRGTRHSAALGLSEVSDALCIVVSEERGEISLAQRSKLTKMGTPAELKSRLVRFCEKHYPHRSRSFFSRLVRENALLKCASLALACVAWSFIVYDAETIQQTVLVPIEFVNKRSELVIDDATPGEARVTLSGYQRTFNLLEPRDLKFVIDLNEFDEGSHRLQLDEVQLQDEKDLKITRVSPRVIDVVLHRQVSMELTVEPTTIGRVPPPRALVSITPNPPKVGVTFIKKRAIGSQRIYTEPIDLGKIDKSMTVKAKLQLPQDVQLSGGVSSTIEVRVEVRQPEAAPPKEQNSTPE
ncbi:MAG: hypothetical protein DWQ42_22030 [Planctomycetota bacterium]|nr:MAG: hypothetical protein DWQ42_22030 [Planctomycetota bacterium]REK47449.1 MAG: hypothetical protein DWQ46_04265 [Planctomycetota bacterium]